MKERRKNQSNNVLKEMKEKGELKCVELEVVINLSRMYKKILLMTTIMMLMTKICETSNGIFTSL